MGDCGKGRRRPPAEQLARRRALIGRLFDAGQIAQAQKHRWGECAHGHGCGLACDQLDKEAGQVPSCVGDRGRLVTEDLYAALKRPEFRCPLGRF